MTTDSPNVLWVVSDQHHPDWVGAAGHPVRTPNVDALADRGVRFSNVVCPSPLCAPCRASLATGLAYDRAPVPGNGADLPAAATTLYGRLRDEAGYHVMGCGKFDLHKASYEGGIDGQNLLEEWGFSAGIDNAGKYDAVLALVTDTNPAKLDADLDWVDEWRAALDAGALEPRDPYGAYLQSEGYLETHVEDYARRVETDGPATFPTSLSDRAYCDNWVGRQGLDLLADAPADRPWFLQVNFAGPHQPWDVTEEMHEWYRDPDVTFPEPVDAPVNLLNLHATALEDAGLSREGVDSRSLRGVLSGGDATAVVLVSRGERRPGGITDRRRTDRVRELHAPVRESFEVRRPHRDVGIHPRPVGTLLVREQKQEVGPVPL